MLPSKAIDPKELEVRMLEAKAKLDLARKRGDKLQIGLLENALNNLLDEYSNTCHT